MPQDWTNLVGGFAQGFGNAKNAAKDRALNEEYKKIAMENVKATAKLHEAQIKKLDMEGGLLKWAMGGDLPGAPPGVAPTPQGGQDLSMGIPQPGPPQTPGIALPKQMASMQTNDLLNPTGGQAPPMGGVQLVGTTGRSATNNNPGNLTSAPYFEQKYGATLEPPSRSGQQKFLKFKTPQDGYNAVLDQIRIDAGRGHTLASFTAKYAPPHENPTGELVTQYSKALGVSPDTPLANISPESLAVPLLARESSTKIIPAGQGQQPQAQKGLGTPQQAMPQAQARGGLTREKFLEGYMDKNFGVKPDEVTVSTYGDHKLVTDKRKGTPLFIIAGQGKTEMIDVAMPDGSVVKRPTVVPPSPIPGGIPVINMAGQPAGGSSLGGPMQVKPPEYTYEEVSAPGGGKQKVPIPKAQPGGAAISTEPPGMKIADVGRTNQILHASDRLKEVNDLLFPGGKLDRSLLIKAAAPGGGIGEGAKFYSKMYQTIDAALRLETGAAQTESEIKVKMQEFWPSVKDTESTIREKNKDLNRYLNGVVSLYDPTGKIGGSRGALTPQAPATASDYLKKRGLQ